MKMAEANIQLRPSQPGLTTAQMLAMATRKQSRSQQLADSHNEVPGLSQEEVKKLFRVFDSEGILLSMDGVTRFRTVEELMRTDVDLGKAFASAIKELETRKSEYSDESRKQLNDILMKRKESLAELRQRIAQSTLQVEDMRIHRPAYRKTSDLFDSPYLKVLSETEDSFAEKRQRRASSYNPREPARTRFHHIPDEELAYYRTVAPFIGGFSTNYSNSSILRPSVRRRYLLRKSREEQQQSVVDLRTRRLSGGFDSSSSSLSSGYSPINRSLDAYANSAMNFRRTRESRSVDRSLSTAGFTHGRKSVSAYYYYPVVPTMTVFSSGGFTRVLRLARPGIETRPRPVY